MLLPLELWLEWLHDDISMAMDGLDREHVYELFERAVTDYICEYLGPLCARLSLCHQGRRHSSRA